MKGKCVICSKEDDVWSMRPSHPLLEEHTQVVCMDCEPYVLAIKSKRQDYPSIYDSFFTGQFLAILRDVQGIKKMDEEERKKIRGLSI